ncbi:MAG: hypothetical protein FP816_11535 [Desulfobacteraceae bacterium]|nr:hypothetical protein [Desulfobacteraceae bacterium]
MATENDLVLIHHENQPLGFARIEIIEPDHKRGWFHVKLLILNLPLQVVTWILRDAYINGEEFTMNGKKMRLEKVVCPDQEAPEKEDVSKTDPPAKEKPSSKGPKVISLHRQKEK